MRERKEEKEEQKKERTTCSLSDKNSLIHDGEYI